MDFTELVDLASEKLGGAVLVANDEFFAPKENLLKPAAPIFIEGKYTDLGKWMDGWETRRRRTPGYDWCIIRLGLPGKIRGVVVDTSFFRGNYPEHCSLEACTLEGLPTVEDLTSEAIAWTQLLPQLPLAGDTQNPFAIESEQRFTHLRFKIYPDGGVARLRVYGEVVPDWDRLRRIGGDIDLAAVENGGLVLACSDMFFGHRHNLIMPGRAANMSDGWETKRRRGPGHDWTIIRLGRLGKFAGLKLTRPGSREIFRRAVRLKQQRRAICRRMISRICLSFGKVFYRAPDCKRTPGTFLNQRFWMPELFRICVSISFRMAA